MKRLITRNISLIEVVFLIICLVLVFLFRTQLVLPWMIATVLIFIVFNKQLTNNKSNIKSEKRFLYAFIVTFVVYMGMQLYIKFGVDLSKYTINQMKLFFQLPLTMTILLGYLFKVRLSDFNWGITLKTLLIIILVFVLLNITDIVDALKKNTTIGYYGINFAQKIFYPSIVEEVIFRGFLLSGLLALNIREDKANIIQAIIFGMIHLINYNEITVITILINCLQIYIGFIIGKIYIKTKSLTPCILLHALLDTV